MITSSIPSTHLLSRYFTSPDNQAEFTTERREVGYQYDDGGSHHVQDRHSTRQSMIDNPSLNSGNLTAGSASRTGLRAYLQSTFHSALHSQSSITNNSNTNTPSTTISQDPTSPTRQYRQPPNTNLISHTDNSREPTSPRRLRRHSFTPVTRITAPAAPLNSETSAPALFTNPRDETSDRPFQRVTTPIYLQSSTPILPTPSQLSRLPTRRQPPAPLSLATPHSVRTPSGLDSASQATSSLPHIPTTSLQYPIRQSIATRTVTPPATSNQSGDSSTTPRTPRSPRTPRDRANRRSMTRGRAETAAPVMSSQQSNGNGAVNPDLPSIRLTPHHDPRATRPSLNFPAITRTLPNDGAVVKVGRYSERENTLETPGASQTNAPVGFKSKVVSRRHCEFWCVGGQWFIKDVKSSSGTFLNHLRLSPPGVESKPWPINDGDVVQLGIDFRGGEEMIFRCVKIRVECNRSWQKGLNSFNTSTHKKLQNLVKKAPKDSDSASVNSSECSICLMSIAPCQPLFVAPCSHVWHYKCIRPILQGHTYPNFLCPNCRAHADLEADIEDITVEDWEESMEEAMAESRRSMQAERNEESAVNGGHTNGEEEEADGFSTPRETLDTAPGAVRSLSPSQDETTSERLQRSVSAEVGSTPKASTTSLSRTEEEDLRMLIGMNRMALQNTTNQASPNSGSAPRPIPAARASTTPSFATAMGRTRDRTPEPKGSIPVVNRMISGESSTTAIPASIGSLNGLIAEGPMTPRNDAGPFVLDGGANRAEQ